MLQNVSKFWIHDEITENMVRFSKTAGTILIIIIIIIILTWQAFFAYYCTSPI